LPAAVQVSTGEMILLLFAKPKNDTIKGTATYNNNNSIYYVHNVADQH